MSTDLTTINFHGATLIAKPGPTPAETLVAMKPIVEGIGLNWEKQRIKLNAHAVLAPTLRVVPFASAGGEQDSLALPLNRVAFWLATIQPNKVPDAETRARVIAYQEECADTLFAHFFGRALDHAGLPNRRETGGIVKAVVGKQVAPLTEQLIATQAEVSTIGRAVGDIVGLVEDLRAQVNGLLVTNDPRRAAVDYVSVREMLTEAKAMTKGRNRINRKMGRELKDRALLERPAVAVRRCPHTGVWLYPRSFAAAYMEARGRWLVQAHNDNLMGQGSLPLQKPKTPTDKAIIRRAKDLAADVKPLSPDMREDALKMARGQIINAALSDGIRATDAAEFADAVIAMARVLIGRAA